MPRNEDNLPIFPIEIFPCIFIHLTQLDMRTVSLTNSDFYAMVKSILWHSPSFRCKLTLARLKQIARLQLPIHRLRLSQLSLSIMDGKEADKIAAYLAANFQLASFAVDEPSFYEGDSFMLIEDVRHFFQLPVTSVHTRRFYTDTLPHELHQLIANAADCKRVYIDGGFHDKLTLPDWQAFSTLPIVWIQAAFAYYEQHDEFSFSDYDSIIGSISPSPDYILGDSHSLLLFPEELRMFRQIKIARLHFSIFSVGNMQRFVDALQQNGQTPSLVLCPQHSSSSKITLPELETLFRLPIAQLETSVLNLDDANADAFVDLICCKHSESGIGKFVIDLYHRDNVLDSSHLDRFSEIGLNYTVTVHIRK